VLEERRYPMIRPKKSDNMKRKEIRCQRCGGRMIAEKYYDVNNVFWGWHCVICGEILDPVILLHRLSQNADLQIPENDGEILNMVKKYVKKGRKSFVRKNPEETRDN
jgi:hypothetical protein